jgi:lipopolysaccharide transport system ATP-binding protein
MGTISVKNIGKAYRVYPGHWSRLTEWVLPALGSRHQLTWVLKDISFTVQSGEAVGIIGINGAGKSTLLKIITGTTLATRGSVALAGRVAALLELGMGFHPDFTGRQNVFMAAQLLGLQSDVINTLMPEIEAFAEIGAYIDQPVRVYSSGMQMRLAFSVATALRPDILIVDEALSVGDSYFQHKSFDRIRQFREQGTTLLLVSHDKGAIQSICDRAILLNGGELAMEGAPEAVMDYYNALLAERGDYRVHQEKQEDGKTKTLSGTGEARLVEVALLDEQGRQLEAVAVGQPITLRIRFRAEVALPEVVLGYQIKDRLGQAIFGTNTAYLGEPLQDLKSGETVEYRFRFPAALGEGTYAVSVALHTSETHVLRNYEWQDLAVVFTVINQNQCRFVGSSWLPPLMECSR